jgi:hypothetical protein
MADDYRPINTAPRDGSIVWLIAEEYNEDCPYPMFWNPSGFNPLVSSKPGIWELEGGGMTWCEEDPKGSPTHWKPKVD